MGKYLLIQFGRVVYNADKLTYKVTLPEINNFLDKYLKLEAWIEHTGKRINSGHYVTIRRKGETFIRMSDDHFTINKNNSIQKSKLCYIALLKSNKTSTIQNLNYAKLENPGLNLCFMNTAVQLIISMKPLSD